MFLGRARGPVGSPSSTGMRLVHRGQSLAGGDDGEADHRFRQIWRPVSPTGRPVSVAPSLRGEAQPACGARAGHGLPFEEGACRYEAAPLLESGAEAVFLGEASPRVERVLGTPASFAQEGISPQRARAEDWPSADRGTMGARLVGRMSLAGKRRGAASRHQRTWCSLGG